MKERVNLIYSDYGQIFGTSTVIIDTDLGRFKGVSYLHPEDEETASRYEGCKYAEIKALREYTKARIRTLKAELKTLVNLATTYSHSVNCSADSAEKRILMKAIYRKETEIKEEKENIETLTKSLTDSIAERDKIIARINKRKQEELDNKE